MEKLISSCARHHSGSTKESESEAMLSVEGTGSGVLASDLTGAGREEFETTLSGTLLVTCAGRGVVVVDVVFDVQEELDTLVG